MNDNRLSRNPQFGIRCSQLIILLILMLAIVVRLLPGPRIVDDAYITFRYARNLITGQGFVYNAGERVLGTTTPLYTLLMATVALISGSRDFPALALVVNALIGATSVGLLYALSKRVSGHWAPAAATALLWTVAPYSVTFAIGGMETELTIALLLAAAYAHVTDHPQAMAVLSALALLARPDTAILLGLLWLDLILRERRLPWQEGLVTLVLLAPWLIFGTLYFGSPLTSSIAAKSATYRLPSEAGFIRLLQHYATPFFEHKALPSIGVLIVFALSCILCSLGGLDAVRRERSVVSVEPGHLSPIPSPTLPYLPRPIHFSSGGTYRHRYRSISYSSSPASGSCPAAWESELPDACILSSQYPASSTQRPLLFSLCLSPPPLPSPSMRGTCIPTMDPTGLHRRWPGSS